MIRQIIYHAAVLLIAMQQLNAKATDEVPVQYKGRFRPFEVYSKLWAYELYHKESISSYDLQAFGTNDPSASGLLWKLYLSKNRPFDDAPLFWVRGQKLKSLLGLNPEKARFSYQELKKDLIAGSPAFNRLMKEVIPYFYFKKREEASGRKNGAPIEISQLAQGLTVTLLENRLVIESLPKNPPWNSLAQGEVIGEIGEAHADKNLAEETVRLLGNLRAYRAMSESAEDPYEQTAKSYLQKERNLKKAAAMLENQFPFQERLKMAGADVRVLPGKFEEGVWYSLKALRLKVLNPENGTLEPAPNFTLYSDETFSGLKKLYLLLEEALDKRDPAEANRLTADLSSALLDAYSALAGKPYTVAHGKALYYPSVLKLKIEDLYYSLPLIELSIAFYVLAAFLLTLSRNSAKGLFISGSVCLSLALIVHTAILLLRSFILARPPVSNMFETVVYVPCVAAWISIPLAWKMRSAYPLIASSVLAAILLVLLKITRLNFDLENVQAVLDSQFWLIIHVLMVVGSYGMFLLSGVLSHIYLVRFLNSGNTRDEMGPLAKMILQTMYLGTALLIPGTILGGIWAAESWGRFWGWDPKESWAFISSCVYLMWIHAFRFGHIGNFGLAAGSIIGLQAITFTWYGVNYILGTGLHTYGFGSGGEIFYYLFVAAELSFVAFASFIHRNRLRRAT